MVKENDVGEKVYCVLSHVKSNYAVYGRPKFLLHFLTFPFWLFHCLFFFFFFESTRQGAEAGRKTVGSVGLELQLVF